MSSCHSVSIFIETAAEFRQTTCFRDSELLIIVENALRPRRGDLAEVVEGSHKIIVSLRLSSGGRLELGDSVFHHRHLTHPDRDRPVVIGHVVITRPHCRSNECIERRSVGFVVARISAEGVQILPSGAKWP